MNNGEKRFIPGTDPIWGRELPDDYSNSLTDKFGNNYDNGWNFDERGDEAGPDWDQLFDERGDEAGPDWNQLTKLPFAKDQEKAKEHERKLGVEIMNLAPDDNFEQVAEALYLVDQYIFPDLFQNKENAKIFAKALFSDDENALFSYKKTFVAKDDENNIIGIAVYRDENCTPWDTEAVRQRFLATGLELPDEFDRANEKYMKKITDAELPKGAAEIEFVGVVDDWRSNGIGARLMKAVMDKDEYTEAHLDVLDSHPGARKLYDKLGFKPQGEKFGNYPDGTEGVQHMVRKKESTA